MSSPGGGRICGPGTRVLPPGWGKEHRSRTCILSPGGGGYAGPEHVCHDHMGEDVWAWDMPVITRWGRVCGSRTCVSSPGGGRMCGARRRVSSLVGEGIRVQDTCVITWWGRYVDPGHACHPQVGEGCGPGHTCHHQVGEGCGPGQVCPPVLGGHCGDCMGPRPRFDDADAVPGQGLITQGLLLLG